MFSYMHFYVCEHVVFKSLMYIVQICELTFRRLFFTAKSL